MPRLTSEIGLPRKTGLMAWIVGGVGGMQECLICPRSQLSDQGNLKGSGRERKGGGVRVDKLLAPPRHLAGPKIQGTNYGAAGGSQGAPFAAQPPGHLRGFGPSSPRSGHPFVRLHTVQSTPRPRRSLCGVLAVLSMDGTEGARLVVCVDYGTEYTGQIQFRAPLVLRGFYLAHFYCRCRLGDHRRPRQRLHYPG